MTASRRIRGVLPWVGWTMWAAFLGTSTAMMVIIVLFGRVPIAPLVRGWMNSFVFPAVFLSASGWWLAYAFLLWHRGRALRMRLAIVPSIPLVLGTSVPVFAVYASDLANHYFYYGMVHLNQPRTLALLLILGLGTLVLQAIYLEMERGAPPGLALEKAVARIREPIVLLLLVAMGALQVGGYLARIDNDFLRYWTVADALAIGATYPATPTYSDFLLGGMPSYTVDLPLYPIMLLVSFGALGHTLAAAYVPTVVSNVVIPPLMYLLFRDVIGRRPVALSLVALVVLFPPLRFYTLNFPGSDAPFVAMTIASAWLLVRMARGDRRVAVWLLFGGLAAASALTRPEGIAYAGAYMLVALSIPAGLGRKAATVALAAAPVIAFGAVMMIVFGVPWPQNFARVTSIQNIVGNWELLTADGNQYLAAAIRLSRSQLVAYTALLLSLALVGSLPWWYRPRRLSVLVLPAWINLLALSMVHPLVSGVRLGFDFFRHASYMLPFLVLAAGVALHAGLGLTRRRWLGLAGVLILNAMLVAGVLWDVQYLSKPSPAFGSDSGNLLMRVYANLVDIGTHRFDLPWLGFQVVEGRNILVAPDVFIANYPDQIIKFFNPFDPIRRATGTAYETGSLFVYIAALVLAILPVRGFASRIESGGVARQVIRPGATGEQL